MMKKTFSTYIKQCNCSNWLTLPVIFLLFTMCQEPYFNDDLDADLKIPVFNGVLSNIDNLSTFELYYAMPYTDQRMNTISGATITIHDNQNQQFQLFEKTPGIYKLPNENMNLAMNKAYTVSIEMPNGEIIKSEPTVYVDTLSITNLYFDYNIKTTVVKNTAGDYNNVTQEGILIQFRIKKPTDATAYYRANANYYVHSEKWVNRTSKLIINEPDWDIVYEIQYDTLYDIYEGFANAEFPIIGELQPHIEYSKEDLTLNPLFLPADRECQNFTQYTANRFIEWVVPVDLYHNSQDVYRYYVNAAKQLNANGQIYDPIPDQIVGNMFNERDPSQTVLGLFDVSSVNRKYISVYVYESLGYRSYQSRMLSDTIIKQGWYPREYSVDTVFVDSLPIEGLNSNL